MLCGCILVFYLFELLICLCVYMFCRAVMVLFCVEYVLVWDVSLMVCFVLGWRGCGAIYCCMLVCPFLSCFGGMGFLIVCSSFMMGLSFCV